MYGHERADDIVGSRFGEFALASNPTNISALRKFITNGYRLTGVETTDLDADGSQRYIANNVIGIVINGVLLRLWGTQHDETERKRAEDDLKVSHAQLRSLAGRLQSIREQERTEIAREMHDVLGQSLTSFKLDLSWLRKKLLKAADESMSPELEARMSEMMIELENTITTVKTLSTELRPGILDKLGLAAAVEWQCQEFEKRSGINCSCHVPEKEISVSDERSTALFRILQESLANVTRHSQATSVKVELHLGKSDMTLRVSDNGRGITSSEISDSSSLGLLGMRERAELLGGHLTISGKPTSGTTVTAQVPFR
jgi:signal transduction histidine kinase